MKKALHLLCNVRCLTLITTFLFFAMVSQARFNSVNLELHALKSVVHKNLVLSCVGDTTAPLIAIKNISLYLNASGNATLIADSIDNGTTDDCDFYYSLSDSVFNCNNIGMHAILVTATDPSGNWDTATAYVTVVDNTDPTATAQNITVYLNGSGSASITSASVNNGSADNCGFYLSLNDSLFNCSDVGVNAVLLTATDASGNWDTATAYVTVVDTTAPALTSNNLTIYFNNSGLASITPAMLASGTDICGLDTLVISKASFSCGDKGANDVVVTLTDNHGNTTIDTVVVTALDTINPDMLAVTSITRYLDTNGIVVISVPEIDNGTDDNCGVDSLWLNKYTFTCSDLATWSSSSSSSSSMTVVSNNTWKKSTVSSATNYNLRPWQGRNDSLPNVSTFSINAEEGQPYGWNQMTPVTGTELVKTTGMITFFRKTFNVGSDQVSQARIRLKVDDDVEIYINNKFVAREGSGDGNNWSGTTVHDLLINGSTYTNGNAGGYLFDSLSTLPVGSIFQTGTNSIILAIRNFTGYDKGGFSFRMDLEKGSVSAPTLSGAPVKLFALDSSANIDSIASVVYVYDTIAPSIRLVSNTHTVYLDSTGNGGFTFAEIDDTLLPTYDNCSINFLKLSDSLYTCSDIGVTTSIELVSNNTWSKSTKVDSFNFPQTPWAALNSLPSSGTFTGSALTGNPYSWYTMDAIAGTDIIKTDNYITYFRKTFTLADTTNVSIDLQTTVDDDIQIFLNDSLIALEGSYSGTSRYNPAHRVFYAKDGSVTNGYMGGKQYDQTSSHHISSLLRTGTNTVVVAVRNAAHTNDKGGFSLKMHILDSDFVPTTHNVLITAKDPSNNVSYDTVVISVEDTIAPTITAQNASIYVDANGNATLTIANIEVSSFDACGIDTKTLSKTSFNCGDLGANSVNFTVTDIYNNSRTVSVTVTVLDTLPPTAVAKNYVSNISSGTLNITAGNINNGSTDNCGIDSMWLSKTSFSYAELTDTAASNDYTVISDTSWRKSTVTTSTTADATPWPGAASILPNVSTYTATAQVGQPYGWFQITPISGTSVVKTSNIVTFFRKTFTIGTPINAAARIRMRVDDDMEIYLNNNFIAREGSNSAVNWSSNSQHHDIYFSKAGTVVNGYMGGTAFDTITGNTNIASLLTSGTNELILAIRNRVNSSDKGGFTFRMDISYGGGTWVTLYVMDANGNIDSAVTSVSTNSGLATNNTNAAGGTYNIASPTLSNQTTDAVENNRILNIYPNPSNNSFNLKLTSFDNETPVDLVIYDAAGKVVSVSNNLTANNVVSFGNDLTKGVYLAKVSQGNFIQNVKLVKLN